MKWLLWLLLVSELAAQTLGLGTMNLGGGNADARRHIIELRRRVAEQVVAQDLQVVAFQEMDVGTGRSGRADYNREILRSVLEARGDVDTSIDERSDGLVRIYTGGGYTVVFGKSIDYDGGLYGNAVLLGPEFPLKAAGVHDLGADDPNGENRTALQVDAGDLTVFAVHLTNGEKPGQRQARIAQYQTLQRLVHDQPDVILAGDFNSQPGGEYPDAAQLGLQELVPLDDPRIDRILVTRGRVRSLQITPGIEAIHDFVTVQVER